MQARHVQALADELGRELQAGDIWQVFRRVYRLDAPQRQLIDYEEAKSADGTRVFAGKISVDGNVQSVSGRGNGLISSVVATLKEGFGIDIDVRDYSEHALTGAATPARGGLCRMRRARWPGRLGRRHRRGCRDCQRPRNPRRQTPRASEKSFVTGRHRNDVAPSRTRSYPVAEPAHSAIVPAPVPRRRDR
jgi:hypothetical protein